MSPMTTADVLRAARDLLTPNVWVNHSPGLREHCAATAVDRVAHGILYRDAVGWLCQAIGVPYNAVAVVRYNDSLKTHGEVLSWFDRAIALAELP